MVGRIQLGERGGAFGGWISKPGINVATAAPGDFLLDTNSQIFQSVAKGVTQVFVYSVSAGYSAGNYGTSVALPAAFAPYSNLCMTCLLYSTDTSGFFNPAAGFTNPDDFSFNVVSGNLNFNVFRAASVAGSGGTNVTTYYAAWNVYRGQF